MLVLSRKREERITIEVGGREIELRVLAVKAGQVRIGFEMPSDVHVRRSELPKQPQKREVA